MISPKSRCYIITKSADIFSCKNSKEDKIYLNWRSYFLLLSEICPGDLGDGDAMLS